MELCEEFEILNLFKFADVKINESPKNILEKITDFILTIYNLQSFSCFVFINLKSYLTNNELEELYDFIAYKKINILLLENIKREEILSKEKIRVIDKDLCEIY